jgi:hypothetical protein
VFDVYVPAGHPKHAVDPVLSAYLPAAQDGHAELWPVTDEYVPNAQPVQLVDTEAPSRVKYRPAAHAVHDDVASPVSE